VAFARAVLPGLWQFNVTTPRGPVAADNTLTGTYKGVATQSGVLISAQP
jgi:hypothetical protein